MVVRCRPVRVSVVAVGLLLIQTGKTGFGTCIYGARVYTCTITVSRAVDQPAQPGRAVWERRWGPGRAVCPSGA